MLGLLQRDEHSHCLLCGQGTKNQKNTKAKTKDYSHLEENLEHFNFKNMKIGVDFDSDWESDPKDQLYKYKLCEEINMSQKYFYSLSKIVNPN